MLDLTINTNALLKTRVEIDVPAVQKWMSQFPQCETTKTEHYFSGGMYFRKLWREADTWIIGKVHKKEHFFMCMSGIIQVYTGTEVITLNPGDVIISKPGTKRITHALSDAIGATVHYVGDITDLDEIEKELLEDDPDAMYDIRNEIIDKDLQIQKKEQAQCHLLQQP